MTGAAASLTSRLTQLHDLNFELATASDVDDLCRMVVDRGRRATGVDRIGIWFLDPQDAGWFVGTFGIDENGDLRDERSSRVPRDYQTYNEEFFERRDLYRHIEESPIYDDRHNVVGHGHLVLSPLWNGAVTIGALAADNHLSRRPISEDDCQLLAILARMVGYLVTIKWTEQQLRETAEAMERLATVDELTGLLNRRSGLQSLQQQVSLSRRTGVPLSVVFMDLDGLKQVNDRYGHATGDQFISEIALVITSVIRESDLACRMGGDEFMIVLPNNTAQEANKLMERLYRRASESRVLGEIGPSPWFSYGLADFVPDGEDPYSHGRDTNDLVEALIHRADQGMYVHKREQGNGRNPA